MPKDENGQSSESDPSAEEAGKPRRPGHTIDLEAKEVEPESDEAEAEGAERVEATAAAESGDAAAEPHEGVEGSEPAETAAEGDAPSGEQLEEASDEAPEEPPQRTQPSEVRGFVTHLAAGLVGGLIGVVGLGVGADYLPLDKLQRPAAPAADTTALEKRFAKLESRIAERPAAAADEGLKQQLAALSDRLAEVEKRAQAAAPDQDVAERIAGIEKQLAEPAAVPKALEDRIAGLEETLKRLAESASEGSGGAVAQAAALSRQITELAQRTDERLAALKEDLQTEAAKRSETLAGQLSEGASKADVDVLAAKLGDRAAKSDVEALRVESAALGEQTTKLTAELAALAKAMAKEQARRSAGLAEVKSELAPLAERVAQLETGLGGVVERQKRSGGDARSTGLAIGFANLKTAIDGGRPFAAELEAVRKLLPQDAKLGVLEAHAAKGVRSTARLRQDLPAAVWAALDASGAPKSDSTLGRLLHGARGLIKVRRTKPGKGDSTNAVTARIEARVKGGDFAGALAEAEALKGPAKAAMRPWLDGVRARLAVDESAAALKTRLIRALSGAGSDDAKG